MSLIALALLALPAAQEPEQPAPPPPKPEMEQRRRDWWASLPEEKRREYEERRRRFEKMTPEERDEMRARMGVLRLEISSVERELTAEQKAEFKQLDERGQREYLERAAHVRLAERSEELRGRVSDPAHFEEYRRRHVKRAVQRAVDEGWIGPAAAAWLETAPLHEAMVVVGDIEKWRFLAAAAEKGLWEEAGVSTEDQHRLLGLAAPEFFRELRVLGVRGGPQERGRRGGRGRGGPPHEGRSGSGEGPPAGAGRGEGPPTGGQRGERGQGQGPPPGRGEGPPRREGDDRPRRDYH